MSPQSLTWPNRSTRDLRDRSIFHITHLSNLPSILETGRLYSHAAVAKKRIKSTNIGHIHIKDRRLRRTVPCAAGGFLGEYVPFNFCPRSVMLIAVNNGHGDYSGGQADVVHLRSTISAAVATGRPWAFTDRHAEVEHALYYDDLEALDEVPWAVMPLVYWRDQKEERQAEFLVHKWFPWSAIEEVTCNTPGVAKIVRELLGVANSPEVSVRREWYY